VNISQLKLRSEKFDDDDDDNDDDDDDDDNNNNFGKTNRTHIQGSSSPRRKQLDL